MSINPVNGVSFGPIGAVARGLVLSPAAIAVLVGKYWGRSHGGSRSAFWMADQVTFAAGSFST